MTETPDLAGRIRRDLYAIADNYDEALEPARRASGSHVKATKEPPLPIGAHVLDARAEAHRDLMYWTRFLLDEVRDVNGDPIQHGPTAVEVGVLVPFIATWVDWLIANHPDDADNLAAESSDHARNLRALAAPHRPEWVPLGKCPLDVDSPNGPIPCGGQVRARPGEDGQMAEATCRGCGVNAVVTWWERVLLPEASRLVTAAELPEFVRVQFGKVVKEPTVRKWIERHVIEAAGTDEKGRTLYDKGAVAYALARRETA